MGDSQPINDLYSREILRHTAALGRLGVLENRDARASRVSRVCGSRVQVDLKLKDGVVADYAQEVEACALGQCAASIMAREIVGKTPKDLRRLRDTMETLLKSSGPAPEGAWADLGLLAAVRDYPARHASVMLVFDAVTGALDEIEEA